MRTRADTRLITWQAINANVEETADDRAQCEDEAVSHQLLETIQNFQRIMFKNIVASFEFCSIFEIENNIIFGK